MIERIILISTSGVKQITNPLALWGDAETLRSSFSQEPFGMYGPRIEFHLVKTIARLKAAVYKEVDL